MLACASAGLVSPNIYAVGQTLSGAPAAGRWMGLQNMFGNISGIIAPALTGVLVDRTGNFMWAFSIAAFTSILGAVAWTVVVGPVEQIDWSRNGA
jgi:ACS family D-galactonate transporter-like MFS transporter